MVCNMTSFTDIRASCVLWILNYTGMKKIFVFVLCMLLCGGGLSCLYASDNWEDYTEHQDRSDKKEERQKRREARRSQKEQKREVRRQMRKQSGLDTSEDHSLVSTNASASSVSHDSLSSFNSSSSSSEVIYTAQDSSLPSSPSPSDEWVPVPLVKLDDQSSDSDDSGISGWAVFWLCLGGLFLLGLFGSGSGSSSTNKCPKCGTSGALHGCEKYYLGRSSSGKRLLQVHMVCSHCGYDTYVEKEES